MPGTRNDPAPECVRTAHRPGRNCPYCLELRAFRVHRNFLQKILTAITGYAPFRCRNCREVYIAKLCKQRELVPSEADPSILALQEALGKANSVGNQPRREGARDQLSHFEQEQSGK